MFRGMWVFVCMGGGVCVGVREEDHVEVNKTHTHTQAHTQAHTHDQTEEAGNSVFYCSHLWPGTF